MKNGFLIIRELFNLKEVQVIRNCTVDYFRNGGGFRLPPGFAKPDWISDPSLIEIKRIVDTKKMKDIIFNTIGEKVKFIGHSDLHLNVRAGWHKDRLSGVAKSFEINNPWEKVDNESMKIYKIITYFQDHTANNDGLEVKIGSHLTENMNFGESKRIKTNPGDAILFDQRITHRGGYSGGYNRISLTMGYGVKNIFFDQFQKGTKHRQDMQNKNKKPGF
jgi:hypothetical protein